MSVQILIVEKTGELKEQKIKWNGTENLYKKAGFKTDKDFKVLTKWNLIANHKKFNIEVYGKMSGRAGQENKYDFPPPIDKDLLFGNALIINKSEGSVVSLSINDWNAIYEKLFGGFEDIGADDSSESEEEDPGLTRTKSGYYKDGFVVGSDESDESESDGSWEEPPKKTKKSTKAKPESKAKKQPSKKVKSEVIEEVERQAEPKNEIISVNDPEFAELMQSANELCEEDYL
jgi:hypothetical protein